jgi:hypothetical protein
VDEWTPEVESEPDPRPKSNAGIVVLLLLVAIGGGAALWRYWIAPQEEALQPAPNPQSLMPPPPPDASVVPLEEGDALMRKLVAGWSSSPTLLRWLAADGIIQRLTAAVRLIARGENPAPVLGFLEVSGDFSVKEQSATKRSSSRGRQKRRAVSHDIEHIYISPASYKRYDAPVSMLTSVDTSAAGKGYAQLRPYFESAYAQVARPGEHFDDVLVQALNRLTGVKIHDGPVELVMKGAIYAFKDPALESLSDPEKRLLRLGPKNARAIQDWCKKFAQSASLSFAER